MYVYSVYQLFVLIYLVLFLYFIFGYGTLHQFILMRCGAMRLRHRRTLKALCTTRAPYTGSYCWMKLHLHFSTCLYAAPPPPPPPHAPQHQAHCL